VNVEVTLEIDDNRGVIWVHSPRGYTLLRICGLPQNLAEQMKEAMKSPDGAVDITVLTLIPSQP